MYKGLPDWYRSRGYLHFDSPINYKAAQSITSSAYKVARHAFYPLISYEISSYKVFYNALGELEKKNKVRSIAYASHVDSHIYAFYTKLLSKKYEEKVIRHGLNECVLAFRSLGKSNIQFADDAFNNIRKTGACSVIALDITGFFDHLDHDLLKQSWCTLIDSERLTVDHFNIYRSLTKYAQVDRKLLYKLLDISSNNPHKGRHRLCDARIFREKVRPARLLKVNNSGKGIPQGTPISAFLSNVYMLDFDLALKNLVGELGGSYYRYCDDMLFIVPSNAKEQVERFAIEEIKKLKLEINEKKTEVRHFYMKGKSLHSDRPLQYLGFTFDGQRKLLRSAALARFSGRMKSGVRQAKKKCIKVNRERKEAGLSGKPLYKRKLYERYSHLGHRNFITYAHRAASQMKSNSIRKQLKPLWTRLQEEMMF